ncbi:hypothetical protein AB9M75_03850 [Lactobacillus sp. AN1001]
MKGKTFLRWTESIIVVLLIIDMSYNFYIGNITNTIYLAMTWIILLLSNLIYELRAIKQLLKTKGE